MKRLLLTTLLFSYTIGISQNEVEPNYDLAAKFSPKNIAKMVHSTSVYPNWLKLGNKFWYQYKTTDGSKYYLVDADRRTRKELFDNDKMAAWLTEITKDPYDAKHLPRFDFKFVKNETAIQFYVTSNELVNSNDDVDLYSFRDDIDNSSIELLKNEGYKTVNDVIYEDINTLISKTNLSREVLTKMIDFLIENKNTKKSSNSKTKKVYQLEYVLGSDKLDIVSNNRKPIKKMGKMG